MLINISLNKKADKRGIPATHCYTKKKEKHHFSQSEISKVVPSEIETVRKSLSVCIKTNRQLC